MNNIQNLYYKCCDSFQMLIETWTINFVIISYWFWKLSMIHDTFWNKKKIYCTYEAKVIQLYRVRSVFMINNNFSIFHFTNDCKNIKKTFYLSWNENYQIIFATMKLFSFSYFESFFVCYFFYFSTWMEILFLPLKIWN